MKRLKDKSGVPKSKAWNLAINIYKLKAKDKATFFSPAESGFSQVPQQDSRRREFVVDSGASMHMVSEKDLNSAELETMKTSRSPTTMMTANGEVRTNKEATICVKQLDLLRQSYASSRNSRSACIEGTLR